MIHISAPTFDLDGSLLLARSRLSNVRGGARRVSRIATLDGGAAVTDLGFSDADRTFQIAERNPDQGAIAKAEYLMRTYPLLICSTEDGCYRGAVQSMRVRPGELELLFLVTERIS
ncbi:hypothetical protein [Geoalkalibacter sp.]|uniref:hypothetical protein n=1 Tax=Geoalkalibacter sp. TaxID=3041440 RepID=UPI00272E470D|nr:hypothetical protein [Geoalkalibacter sp.]